MKREELPKLLVSIFLVFVLTLALFMASSSSAEAKPIVLKYANPMPVSDKQAWGLTLKPWGEAIEKRSNGRMKLKAYHSGSLIKFPATPNSMKAGMADLAYFSTMFAPAFFPSWLFGGVLNPITSPRSPFEGIMISYILYDEFPSFSEELKAKNMMVLLHNSTVPLTLISKKECPSLADLKGKRIRIFAGEYHAELVKLQEANPVMIPWPEVYESLDKGIVDGMVTVTTGMRDLKLYEVAEYLYTMGDSFICPLNCCFMTLFSVNTFKKLSPELRLIILEEAKRIEREYSEIALEELYPDALKEMRKGGLKITPWPAEDLAKWNKIVGPLYQKVGKKMEEKGLPGSKMVNRYLELISMPRADLEKLYENAWERKFKAARNMR